MRHIISIIFLYLYTCSLNAQETSVSVKAFSPSELYVGERGIIQFVCHGTHNMSIDWKTNSDWYKIIGGPFERTNSSLSFEKLSNTTKIEKSISYTYVIEPTKIGKHTIPSAIFSDSLGCSLKTAPKQVIVKSNNAAPKDDKTNQVFIPDLETGSLTPTIHYQKYLKNLFQADDSVWVEIKVPEKICVGNYACFTYCCHNFYPEKVRWPNSTENHWFKKFKDSGNHHIYMLSPPAFKNRALIYYITIIPTKSGTFTFPNVIFTDHNGKAHKSPPIKIVVNKSSQEQCKQHDHDSVP